jgi:hypothetical protein
LPGTYAVKTDRRQENIQRLDLLGKRGAANLSDEDLAMLALLEFLDACETGVAAAKHLIREAKIGNELEETWLPEKICWEKAEGASGPYERSEDFNSLDFKAMLKDLEAHEGKLSRDGYFYWTFKNRATVGRKLRQKTQAPNPT